MVAWMATAAGVGTATAVGVLGPRLGYRALHKDPHTPVERFGFHLHDPASRTRVAGIIEAFFGGYNVALGGATPESVRARCAAFPEVLHPFAFEGSGMGFGAHRLLDWRPQAPFETFIDEVRDGWCFMYYIGLGIWTAFLGHGQTERVAKKLRAPQFAGLLYDGVGFKCGFFHRVRDAAAHRRLAGVPEAERAHAYRGFGRSLWFVFRDDPVGLEAAVAALPEAHRAPAVVGIGLAVTFTRVDDLGAALAQLASLPAEWTRELERGLRLALYVRHAGQAPALQEWIAAVPRPEAERLRAHLQHAVHAYETTIDRADFLHSFTRAC
jgi:hypothetical protein